MEVTVKMTYEEACYLARLVGKELHSAKLVHKADKDYTTAREGLIDRLLFSGTTKPIG